MSTSEQEYIEALKQAEEASKPQETQEPPKEPEAPAEAPAEPAKEGAAEPTPLAKEPDKEPPAPADEPFAGFSALSPEAQEVVRTKLAEADGRIKELETTANRYRGQITPQQQQNEQLRRQNQQMAERLKKLEESHGELGKQSFRAQIEKLREQYPDEAAALGHLAEQVDAGQSRTAEDNRVLHEQVEEIKRQLNWHANINALTDRHPDWKEIVRDPEWNAWKAALDPVMRGLADAEDADRASIALDNFKRDRALARYEIERLKQQQSPPAPPTRAKPEPDPNPAVRRSVPGAPATASMSAEEANYQALLAEASAYGFGS